MQIYIKIIIKLNWNFYIRLLSKLILLLKNLCDFIIKIIKSLHNMSKANINHFLFYHLYYIKKIIINHTRTFLCTTNCLYLFYNLCSFSIGSFFAYDSRIYIIEPNLVFKKKELLTIFLYLFFYLSYFLFPFFSLTIFEYTFISK